MGPTWLHSETISGTIQDPSGAVIAGARIEITGGDLVQPILLSSDGLGKFASPDLKPGTYSLRVTRVGEAPLELLGAVDGLELVDLAEAQECCGFGGTFAIKNADTSSAMVNDKCRAIIASGASVVTALDSSCLLQIGGRLSREGAAVQALHLAEILAHPAAA